MKQEEDLGKHQGEASPKAAALESRQDPGLNAEKEAWPLALRSAAVPWAIKAIKHRALRAAILRQPTAGMGGTV